MFTAIDVLNTSGLTLTKRNAWRLGQALQRKWTSLHGTLPDKAVLPKTRGKGSHCFACYPDWFRVDAVDIAKSMAIEQDSQMKLF